MMHFERDEDCIVLECDNCHTYTYFNNQTRGIFAPKETIEEAERYGWEQKSRKTEAGWENEHFCENCKQ